MSEIELLFLGTGTSAGIPMIGCHCAVCTSTDPHDKRTRPSVVISYNGIRVLVDTSPELRLQCVTNHVDNIDAIVFMMGLDDVRRFNALRGSSLDVWADQTTHATLFRIFGYAFREPSPEEKVFRPHLEPRTITGPFEIAGLTWQPIPLFHGQLPILGFRIGRLAYCTDVSHIPDEAWPLLRGLDVLVLDALQHKKHPTHFNLEEAIDAAKKIRAAQTLFTHIAHGLSHAETNASLPTGMRLAHDGERITARA
jgi:phosphoribosyl 1,2-cyclic phosphate phosphodiesterase